MLKRERRAPRLERSLELWALFGSGLLATGLGLSACGGDARDCAVDADCASGSCRTDGTCAPASATTDAGPGTANGGDAGHGAKHDAGAGGDALPVGDGGACAPNHDGVIDRSEVGFVVGAHANFRIAQGVTVDTAGKTQQDGSRVWDFSGALSGDHDVKLDTEDPASAWYAADFSGASFAAKISDSQALRGVYQATNDAILLMGVVSPQGGSSRTELDYNAPVAVLQFPLHDGVSWSATPTVSGTTNGTPSSAVQSYQSSVDAHGTLVTPLGTFDVLRVATSVSGPFVYTKQFTFVTECFGTVAVITSNNGETQSEFTTAAEIKRLAP